VKPAGGMAGFLAYFNAGGLGQMQLAESTDYTRIAAFLYAHYGRGHAAREGRAPVPLKGGDAAAGERSRREDSRGL
jgi:hypothetical protein